MEYLLIFVHNTFELIAKQGFSPLVLMGLMITSLSLVLTLKDSNIYIKKFKSHDNITLFVERIFKTSGILIFLFMYSIFISYLDISQVITHNTIFFYTILSILYLVLILILLINLFMITFIIKNIVLTSLRETKI